MHTSRSHIPTDRRGQTLVSTNPKTLGDRIKVARFLKGLYQPELAKMLDVGLITLRRWERNEEKPTPDQLVVLARTLDLPTPQTQQQDHLLGFYQTIPSSIAQIA